MEERDSWVMPYVKVIQSGNVLEVYEMEKKPYNRFQDKEFTRRQNELDGYDKTVMQDLETSYHKVAPINQQKNRETIIEGIHSKRELRSNRREERRSQTLRDGKNKVRRLALANFTENDWLLTLTYAENMQDVKQADKDFKAFIRKLRKDYKDLKYLAVREFQKRGAIHFHVLINYPFLTHTQYGDKGFTDELMHRERVYGDMWGHGFIDLQTLKRSRSTRKEFEGKAVDNVGAYIAKYMNKSADDERLRGHKLFLPSKNLEKPVVLTDMEAIMTLDILEMHTKKETFTNTYKSEYLGKIIYKEYNMSRLKEQRDTNEMAINGNNLSFCTGYVDNELQLKNFVDSTLQMSYILGEVPITFEEE